jgi:hypothetical protein
MLSSPPPLTFPIFINALLSAPDQVPPQAMQDAKTHFCKNRFIYETFYQYSAIHTSLFKIVTFHRFHPRHVTGSCLSGHRRSNTNQTYKLYLTVSRSSHPVCFSLSASLLFNFRISFFHYVPINCNTSYVYSQRVKQYHALRLYRKTNL